MFCFYSCQKYVSIHGQSPLEIYYRFTEHARARVAHHLSVGLIVCSSPFLSTTKDLAGRSSTSKSLPPLGLPPRQHFPSLGGSGLDQKAVLPRTLEPARPGGGRARSAANLAQRRRVTRYRRLWHQVQSRLAGGRRHRRLHDGCREEGRGRRAEDWAGPWAGRRSQGRQRGEGPGGSGQLEVLGERLPGEVWLATNLCGPRLFAKELGILTVCLVTARNPGASAETDAIAVASRVIEWM